MGMRNRETGETTIMADEKNYKIICTDNFARDNVSDSLTAENLTEYMAKRIVELLNEKEGTTSSNFYKAVPNTYKLFEGDYGL
jgi:hypothetical protein